MKYINREFLVGICVWYAWGLNKVLIMKIGDVPRIFDGTIE